MMKKGYKCNFVDNFSTICQVLPGALAPSPILTLYPFFSRMQKLDECIFIFISVQTMLKMPEIFEK